MFENAVLPGGMGTRSRWTFALSLSAQAALMAGVVFCSLWYSDALPLFPRNERTILPPPPLPRLVPTSEPRAQSAASSVSPIQPTRPFRPVVPTANMPLTESSNAIDPPPAFSPNGPGGSSIPDGVPNGTGALPTALPPPPPPQQVVRSAEPIKIIRATSTVLAGKLLHQVIPVYPPLAKAARIQGVVLLQGVVAQDGTIKQLQVISGHPLLAAAALAAVRQWTYRSTLLNGQPVEVVAPIEVRFTLGQ